MLFGAIAQLVGSLYGAHRVSSKVIEQADEWFKLSLSLSGTAMVTFLGIFGTVGAATLASGQTVAVSVAVGLFAGSSATAAAVYGIWRRSSLTKGIPILAPMKVAQDEMQAGTVYLEPKKEK